MHTAILGALFPVFGLIVLGFVCGRTAMLGERAFEVLNRLVIAITLPVLTFRTLARMRAADFIAPTMIVAVLGGAFATYALGYVIERRLGRSSGEANIAGLAACFSNTGFIGLPIALLAYGPASLAPGAVAMALYASIVFAVAIVIGELGTAGATPMASIHLALRAIMRSPLIVLSAAGVLWSLAKLPIPGAFDTLLSTLAGATAPCALIAIGLFIALPRDAASAAPVARAVALKLVVHPGITALLLFLLPSIPSLWARMAILMAAMPSGATSFVLAGRAGRWALEVSAWTVMLTTCLAALTISFLLWWMP